MKTKTNNNKYIIIIYEHSSQFNMQFISYCNEYNILFTIFILDFTHQLQFLDVFVFFKFIFIYLNQINKFV